MTLKRNPKTDGPQRAKRHETSSDRFQMLVRACAGQTQQTVQASFVDMFDGVLGCANIL